jgi:hypothetical protein
MIESRLEKLERAMKQVPDVELDAEKWAEQFAGNEGRQPGEGDRQEARGFLAWCKKKGYPPSECACLEWAILTAWERREEQTAS